MPINAGNFAPFGELIAATERPATAVNAARFERFDGLARIDCGDAINVGIMRCAVATELPCSFDLLERHPLGSQAFVPLDPLAYVVVVGPASDAPQADALRAFVVPPRCGINMRAGIWHLPLLGSTPGQTFAVFDRTGDDNLEEYVLAEPVWLEAAL